MEVVMKICKYVSLFLCYFNFQLLNAETFDRAKYEVCFTPIQNCVNVILHYIDHAEKSLFIQAYSFTSVPIAQAVIKAQKRHVKVKIILDKSQFSEKYSSAKFLMNQGIPTWRDDKVAIAHNKVMIIDQKIVLTGSLNFTKSAQQKNAENILVIEDVNLAKKYFENWESRKKLSVKIN
jgi:phosphatidylserine/phosphatidylglycerophosphate/cardiolipin synthase-like enzyme